MVKSLYADRDTVGTIYRNLQETGSKDKVEVGDMCREVMSSLVEDLNDTIKSDPYEGKPFYICIHEKKDMMMPSMLLRRVITSLYRPYPEDDTTVFWTSPKSNETLFCWCIPHWSEMDNIIANEELYDVDLVLTIKAWKSYNLEYFGFMKDDIGNWIPNLRIKDKKMEAPKSRLILPC